MLPDISGKIRIFLEIQSTTVDKWPHELKLKLSNTDMKTLRVLDATYSGLCIRKSSIPGEGNGVFSGKKLLKGTMVGWYNGAILYLTSKQREKMKLGVKEMDFPSLLGTKISSRT